MSLYGASNLLWIALNADARAEVAAAAGGFFSVGAALEQIGSPAQEVVFGFTTSAGVQQLVVCFDSDADSDGDGVTDAGNFSNATHQYPSNNRSYTVILTVTNPYGSVSVSTTVTTG